MLQASNNNETYIQVGLFDAKLVQPFGGEAYIWTIAIAAISVGSHRSLSQRPPQSLSLKVRLFTVTMSIYIGNVDLCIVMAVIKLNRNLS